MIITPNWWGRQYENGIDPAILLPRTTSAPGFFAVMANQRLPSDPLFYAPVILENVVVGSRYYLFNPTDHTALVPPGTATESPFTIPLVPAYASPQMIGCTVRYSSAVTKYYPITIYAYQNRGGVSFYISQVVDTVAE